MTKPDFSHYFLAGIRHFNAREFWEAHEAWETIWLAAESNIEQFLQGLIQVAAAYHHIQRGTYRGAIRLIDAGLKRLEPFPMRFCGIDRTIVEDAARRHRAWLAASGLAPDRPLSSDDYPKLTCSDPPAVGPPIEQW
jgi:uncharacterized protein